MPLKLNAKLKRKYNEVFSQYTCVQLTPANSRYGKYVPYRNGIVIRNGFVPVSYYILLGLKNRIFIGKNIVGPKSKQTFKLVQPQ
jgi:hypothetical protein